MSRYKTPLRYPGGKQRLTPFIVEIMRESGLIGGSYVEPFAGGAGVAIELLLGGHVGSVHLNDLSKPIYSFWRSILTKTDEFCRRVGAASLTVKEWRRQKEVLARPNDHSQLDLAFSLFFLNRCNRSGITTGGVIGGLHQSGEWKMDVRFPKNELIHRIEAIAAKKKAISVRNLDAQVYLSEHLCDLPRNTLVYCDPPYYHKADRLYLNHYEPKDHARIAKVIQRDVARPWVVSYDNAPEVIKCYSKRRHFQYDLQYTAAKAYMGKEVFFFSDDLNVPAVSEVPCVEAALKSLPPAKRRRLVASVGKKRNGR